jgi:hypothetical protein
MAVPVANKMRHVPLSFSAPPFKPPLVVLEEMDISIHTRVLDAYLVRGHQNGRFLGYRNYLYNLNTELSPSLSAGVTARASARV